MRPGPRDANRVSLVLLAALLLLFARAFARPVADVDTHWHAATGRWILQEGRLPTADPFGMYQADGPRARTILRGYWLAQVAMAAVLEAAGARGLVALKTLLLLATLLATPLRSWRGRGGPPAALAATALAGWVLVRFDGDRPQLFSFALAAGTLAVAERVPFGRGHLALLAALALVWPHLHPGATLGAVLLLAWAAGAAWTRSTGGDSPPPLAIGAVVLAAMLTTFGPSGLDGWRTLVSLSGSDLQGRTSEWMSPWAVTRELGAAMPEVWALLALAALGAAGLAKERRYDAAVPLALLLAVSLAGFRFVPFLAAAGAAWIPGGVAALRRPQGDDPDALTGLMRRGLPLAALGTASWLALAAPGPGVGLSPGAFPSRSASWLCALPARPGARVSVFTHLDFGGYLLWSCPATVRPFVDGRLLDVDLLAPYTNVLWATAPGIAFLEGEGFRFVLVPQANSVTGELYPIVPALKASPRWQLLFEGPREVLFARTPLARDHPARPED